MRRSSFWVLLGATLTLGCGSGSEPAEPAPTPAEPAEPREPSAPEPTPEPAPEATALCSADGWCVEDQGYATLASLQLVGVAPTYVDGPVVYGLTDRGVVRYDGQRWSVEPLDNEEPWAIGGVPGAEPVVVARDGTFFERTGGDWRVAHRSEMAGLIVDDAWVRSADNAWAEVRGDDGQTRLMHWNGTEWTQPAPLEGVEQARSLAAVSPDWAVVVHGSGDAQRAVLVEHSESDGWTGRDLDTPTVSSVWVGAGDIVLGVRGDTVVRVQDDHWVAMHRERAIRRFGYVTSNGARTVAIGQGLAEMADVDDHHLSRVLVGAGDEWSLSEPMAIMGDVAYVLPEQLVTASLNESTFVRTADGWTEQAALNAVWAHTGSAAYAVGDRGLVRRFDGTRWVDEDSGTEADLLAVHGHGDAVIAVGRRGTILRRGADGWSVEASTTETELRSVWVGASDRAYVTAAEGEGERNAFVLERRDGAWHRVETGALSHVDRVLSGSDGAALGMTYGGDLRGDGVPGRTPAGLNDVWFGVSPSEDGASGPGYFALAQDNAAVFVHDGEQWRTETLPEVHDGGGSPRAIHGSSSGALVVGDTGQVWQRGQAWAEESVVSTRPLRDVFALPSGEAWAVGEAGLILHRAPAAD